MEEQPQWSIRGLLIWMLMALNFLLFLIQASPTAHSVGRSIATFIAEGGEKAAILQKTSWRHNLGINRSPAVKYSDRDLVKTARGLEKELPLGPLYCRDQAAGGTDDIRVHPNDKPQLWQQRYRLCLEAIR